MKSFYEKHREESGLLVYRHNDYIFPAHFHVNLEIFIVKKGKYTISVNENTYDLQDGGIAVIDSYDIHSYDAREDVDGENSCVLIIPYGYLRTFNEKRKNLRLSTPVIHNVSLCDELLSIVDTYFNESERIKEAAVDLFLALLQEKLTFDTQPTKNESALIRQILSYIHENFRYDVSRGAIARALGYAEAHISRVFHRYMKVGLADYVNGLRLSYIERLQKSGDPRKIIELIYEAGFKSQQTYYRCKKEGVRFFIG